MGIDGETLSHNHGALEFGQLGGRDIVRRKVSIRKSEEECGRQYDHDGGRNVDGPIARVLQPSTPAEGRIAGEILVVFAKLSFHSLFG